MPKPEYQEGPEASENLRKFASAILQLPKAGTKRQAKPTARKKSGKKRG